jgi:hypothetical protein
VLTESFWAGEAVHEGGQVSQRRRQFQLSPWRSPLVVTAQEMILTAETCQVVSIDDLRDEHSIWVERFSCKIDTGPLLAVLRLEMT